MYAAHYETVRARKIIRKERNFCLHLTVKQAFKAADHFLKEAERQKSEPKACEHTGEYYKSCDDPLYVWQCSTCKAAFTKPPQFEPKACAHIWIPWSIVEPETERCKLCARVVYKYSREPIDNAEPPKPKREAGDALEWNMYQYSDGSFRAFDKTGIVLPYSGKTPPFFVCKVREIIPGDDR